LDKHLLRQVLLKATFKTRIQELFIAKVNELKIEINPRYGKWDAVTGQIIAADVAGDAVTPSNE
jgi:hypothetical protein